MKRTKKENKTNHQKYEEHLKKKDIRYVGQTAQITINKKNLEEAMKKRKK